jgi:hypothetical protein
MRLYLAGMYLDTRDGGNDRRSILCPTNWTMYLQQKLSAFRGGFVVFVFVEVVDQALAILRCQAISGGMRASRTSRLCYCRLQ